MRACGNVMREIIFGVALTPVDVCSVIKLYLNSFYEIIFSKIEVFLLRFLYEMLPELNVSVILMKISHWSLLLAGNCSLLNCRLQFNPNISSRLIAADRVVFSDLRRREFKLCGDDALTKTSSEVSAFPGELFDIKRNAAVEFY